VSFIIQEEKVDKKKVQEDLQRVLSVTTNGKVIFKEKRNGLHTKRRVAIMLLAKKIASEVDKDISPRLSIPEVIEMGVSKTYAIQTFQTFAYMGKVESFNDQSTMIELNEEGIPYMYNILKEFLDGRTKDVCSLH
jgi:hypothetical protein